MKTLRSCFKIRNTHFYIIRWRCRLAQFIFLFLCSITFPTCSTTCYTCSFPFPFFLILLTLLIVLLTFIFLISLSTLIKILIKVNIQNINQCIHKA